MRMMPGCYVALLSLFGQTRRRVYISWPAISSRAHKLEGFDYLFAIRMLVNLARGTVGEFMLVMCRNRIAEHQRVNDPDCTWLHCLPPPPIDFQNGAVRTMPIVTESAGQAHSQTACVHRETTLCTCS